MNLTLLTATIKKTNSTEELKQEILDALCNLSDCDCDFNGENGADYLWEEAQGYESNRDYLLDKVSQYDVIEVMIYKYFDRWIGHDTYYDTYNYDIIYNENNEIIAIALAYGVDN